MNSYSNVLCIHAHTTGLDINFDGSGKDQALSIALAVFDLDKLESIDSIYTEIKFQNDKPWDTKLESIHGFTEDKSTLDHKTIEDAIIELATFILQNFDISRKIPVFGYNVYYHLSALKNLFLRYSLSDNAITNFSKEIQFNNNYIDIFPIGTLISKYSCKSMIESLIANPKYPLSSLHYISYYQKMYKFMKTLVNTKINELYD